MDNTFIGIDVIRFGKMFNSNEDCMRYLYHIKWVNGYTCTKCGCTKEVKGKTSFYRRCKKCGYDESVTANTLFHKVKIPLLKAFHIVFRTVSKKKGMSSIELATEVGVQQKTAWLFKLKIKNAMVQYKKEKLKGKVQVDETLIGGYSKGNVGRSLETKQAVIIAVEELPNGKTGNLEMRVLEDFTKDILSLNIDEMVSKESTLKTDKFSSYTSMRIDGRMMEQGLSNKGNFLHQLHNQILCFKLWLKGTHHKCSASYLQTYLDEYIFRFNRRNKRANIFDSIISKFMNAVPKQYSDLTIPCNLNT